MASARRLPSSYNTSTYGNGTRDYTSLSTWESATDNDLVTATDGEVLDCYDDSASFSDQVTLSGATTSSSYFRVIRPANGEGHDGTPNNGVFFDRSAASSDGFAINEAYTQVHDIICKFAANNTGGWRSFVSSTDNAGFVGCISWDISNDGSGVPYHFGIFGSLYMILCAAIGGTNTNGGVRAGAAGDTSVLYNNTIYHPGGTGAVKSGGSNQTAYNNLVDAGSETDWTIGFFGETNASSDATAPSNNGRINQTFTFADAGNDDVKLSTSDAGAKDFGTDMSADGTYAFDDDILGVSFVTWDIGFHEPNAIIEKSGSELVPLGVVELSELQAIVAVSNSLGIGLQEVAAVYASLDRADSTPIGLTTLTALVSQVTGVTAEPCGVSVDQEVLVKIEAGL